MKRSACAAREVAACRRVDVFLIKSAPAVLKRQQDALNFTFAVIYYFTLLTLQKEIIHLMAESKLRALSVDFAVQILNLVKFLKSQQKRSFPIKSAEPEPVSEQTSTKPNMLTANRTLLQNCKSHSKKPAKQVTGWNFS